MFFIFPSGILYRYSGYTFAAQSKCGIERLCAGLHSGVNMSHVSCDSQSEDYCVQFNMTMASALFRRRLKVQSRRWPCTKGTKRPTVKNKNVRNAEMCRSSVVLCVVLYCIMLEVSSEKKKRTLFNEQMKSTIHVAVALPDVSFYIFLLLSRQRTLRNRRG